MRNRQKAHYISIKFIPIVYACFFILTIACSKLDDKYQAINASIVHQTSMKHIPHIQEYPLHSAIRDGDLDELKRLLSTGQANVNATDNNGCCPLVIATKLRHLDIVQILLQHHAYIDATDNNGWTTLHFAATSNCLDIVQMLLKHKANINAANQHGRTALYFAVDNYYLDIVQELLKHNDININATAKSGWTVLHCAATMGYADIVQILLSHQQLIEANVIHAALNLAQRYSHTECINLLKKYKQDLDTIQ